MSERDKLMSALVLDIDHWRAAQQRRADRERAIVRRLYSGPPPRKQLSLDEVLGPVFDPKGGAA